VPNEVSFVFLLFANQIRSPPHRLRNRIRLKQGTILPTDEEIRVTGLDPPKTWRAIMAGALSLEFRETLIRHSRQERGPHMPAKPFTSIPLPDTTFTNTYGLRE
jgi:hypothetical protein